MAAPRTPPTLTLLVRHAETPSTGRLLPGRAPGLHLGDAGRRQAEALATRLGRLRRVVAVYTSPLDRARETAVPIARAFGLLPREEPDLTELDCGHWTGRRLSRLRRSPEWSAVEHHPASFRFPGGESFIEMQARVVTTLLRLVERHPGRTVVVVSHADPIKALLAHALGMPLDLFQRLAVAPGSVSAIAWTRAGPAVVALNSLDGELAGLEAP